MADKTFFFQSRIYFDRQARSIFANFIYQVNYSTAAVVVAKVINQVGGGAKIEM